MPFLDYIQLQQTHIYLWELTEDVFSLQEGIQLSPIAQKRLSHIQNEKKQREFFAIRQLLQKANISQDALSYTSEGKPLLEEGHISITHSYPYVMVGVSTYPIGIDLEKCTPRILRLASRFTSWQAPEEMNIQQQIAAYTQIWTIKEALYKIAPSTSVRFAEDLHITHYVPLATTQKGQISFQNQTKAYQVKSFFWQDYVWSWVGGK